MHTYIGLSKLQVLIFSQFKIMMHVLEDSLRLKKYPVERIDGSVSSRDRQAAIDRYSKSKYLAPQCDSTPPFCRITLRYCP